MTTEERGPETAPRGNLFGPRLVAIALLALGAFLIVSALGITRGGGYQLIGPATIPLFVAVGLLAVSGLFLVRTTVVPDRELAEHAAEEERSTDWPTVGLIAVALVAYALALGGFTIGPLEVPGLGYPVATGLFLPLAARILGSRSPIRDTVAGFAIGVVVYLVFTQFLGVRLPAGILDFVL